MSENELLTRLYDEFVLFRDKVDKFLFIGNGVPSAAIRLSEHEKEIRVIREEFKKTLDEIKEIVKIKTCTQVIETETEEQENAKVALRVAKHFKQYWLRWVAGGTIAGLSVDKFQALFEILTK